MHPKFFRQYDKDMKKSNFVALCFLLILLAACKDKPSNLVTIEGNIAGLGNDTVYLYGSDIMYSRLDTLVSQEGKFRAELDVDTLVISWLQFSDGTEYPLYMDKGNHIRIEGSAEKMDSLNISGNILNEELTAFRHELANMKEPTQRRITKVAGDYIESHLASLTSIYVLDKYFIQQNEPDFRRIERLIENMTGELKDQNYIKELNAYIETQEKVSAGKSAPYFQLPNRKGEKVDRTDFKDKYLLLHFWASWEEHCRKNNAELRALYKKKAYKKDLAILGISLDLDKEQWKEALKQDTLEWEQVCDFQGWNSNPVKQFGIRELPSIWLLNPSGRIEGKNLTLAEVEEKLKEITKK